MHLVGYAPNKDTVEITVSLGMVPWVRGTYGTHLYGCKCTHCAQ